METPLLAYKSITVPVDAWGDIIEVKVPFTIELLQRVEECLFSAQDVGFRWFRLKKSDKTVREAYEAFSKPYLPSSIDLTKVQPTFFALFFSAVKKELLTSIEESEKSTVSTPT